MVQYGRLRMLFRSNLIVRDEKMRNIFFQTCQEMGMKGEIGLYQNYTLQTPIVTGIFKKIVILPMRDYDEIELTAVFYHELVHIKKKDLWIKKLIIFLCLFNWVNPLAHILRMNIEEWSETDCDFTVCYETNCSLSKRQYFMVALKGLTESYVRMNKVVMQFNAESSLKRRVLKMQDYEVEKDIKTSLHMVAAAVFSIAGMGIALIAENGIVDLYEKLYKNTAVEVSERVRVERSQEKPIEIFAESYDITVIEKEIVEADNFTKVFEWFIPVHTIVQSPEFYACSGDTICVALNIEESEKQIEVGIIEPDGTRRYQEVSNMKIYKFSIDMDGTYHIFLGNMNRTAIMGRGYYTNDVRDNPMP
ncbi:M56 family metallopeptidase [Lachnospiraceae bacterium ZAX-1]